MRIPRQWIPSLITFITLSLGMLSIALSIEGYLSVAGALILAGYLLDAVDGEVARRLGVSSPFGIHLDSLVDIVHFGAATTVLVWQHLRETPASGWLLWLLGIGFVTAGAFRLARFNLEAEGVKTVDTLGLTISTSGAYITLSVLADLTFGHELLPDWLFLALLPLISMLMTSRIQFPELQTMIRGRWISIALLSTSAIIAVWLTPQLVWLGLTTGYISYGLVRAGYRRF